MPINSVEIMKIIDERESRKKKERQKRTRGTKAIVKGWEVSCFLVCLSFLQLICKASLIFKLNLKLSLSIILKERELYESMDFAMECRCLKTWDMLSSQRH